MKHRTSSRWIHLDDSPTPKAQGTSQGSGWRDCEDLEFAMRLCLLVMPEATPINCPQHELSKENNNGCVKLDRAKPLRPQPSTKNHWQLRKAGSRKESHSQGEHGAQLSSAKWPGWKTGIQVALQSETDCIWEHISAYMVTLKRDHEFESK